MFNPVSFGWLLGSLTKVNYVLAYALQHHVVFVLQMRCGSF